MEELAFKLDHDGNGGRWHIPSLRYIIRKFTEVR
jgi:hypothetical protein